MTSPQEIQLPPLSIEDRPQWDIYLAGARLVALRVLGDPAAAEDVAQEAVTRAIAAVAEPHRQTIVDLGAFVYGIARHIICDIQRKGSRDVTLSDADDVEDSAPDALTALIGNDERARVRDALAELSDADRHLLYLSFFEGLDPTEIAERMREPVVRIRKRKSRALERLRRAFLTRNGHDSRD